jgi:hypothetical protein
MKKYLCTLTISISLFLIAGPVYAGCSWGQFNVILGNVSECANCGAEGEPLPGAFVWLEGTKYPTRTMTAHTNDDGMYSFIMFPDDCYTLTSWKPGYGAVTKENVCVKGCVLNRNDFCLG